MSWGLTIKIVNNTPYKLDVVNNSLGLLKTIQPNTEWQSDELTDPNNANALRFFQTENVWYMQGGISAGPEAGVYVDKGWESPTTISANWNANETEWTQSANGGYEILAWNQFEQGGEVAVQFNTI